MNLTDRQKAALHALHALQSREEARRAAGEKMWDDYWLGHTAGSIAFCAGIDGVRRHGSGAVKGSWSGTTSPALAAASTCASLARRGLATIQHDEYYRNRYKLTEAGRALAESTTKETADAEV